MSLSDELNEIGNLLAIEKVKQFIKKLKKDIGLITGRHTAQTSRYVIVSSILKQIDQLAGDDLI